MPAAAAAVWRWVTVVVVVVVVVVSVTDKALRGAVLVGVELDIETDGTWEWVKHEFDATALCAQGKDQRRRA